MLAPHALDGLPLFRDLTPGSRAELAARGTERRFTAGEVLFTAGSAPRGFYVIVEGEVRVLRGSEGRQHVIHVEGPGGTLGEVSLFDGAGYPATAVASRPSRVLLFSRAAVEAAIAADPAVAWLFLRRLASRVRHLVDRLDRLAARSVTARLATLLLARSRETGSREFALGRTQTQTAEELGTVREVLVRSLRDLRTAGVIQWVGRGRYAIVDEDELRRRAGVSDPAPRSAGEPAPPPGRRSAAPRTDPESGGTRGRSARP